MVLVLSTLFLLLLALGTCLQLWLDYGSYLDVAENTAANTTALLEEYTGQTFKRIDHTLLDVRGEAFWKVHAGRKGMAADARLTLLAASNQAIRCLTMVDEAGLPFASSGLLDDEPEDYSQNEAFRHLRGSTEDVSYVSVPHRDPRGVWHYHVSHRLVAADGKFHGIVVADVEPGYFERLFRATGLGERAVVSLLRRDGIVIVRLPHKEDAIGRNVLRGATGRTFLPIPSEGTASMESVVDGVKRIGYFRALDTIPLIVNVALPIDDALRPWWRRVQESILIFLAVTAAMALLAFLIARQGASLRRAQDTARLNERRLQGITSNIPGVVFERVVRPDGATYYTYVSSAAWDVLGLSPAEMQADNQRLRNIIVPEDWERVAEGRIQSARNLTQWAQEFRINVNGQIRWLRVIARPQRLENGDIVWDGVYTDITAEKATTEELRQAQKMEAIGQLTGGIAHDFNNLLMVVQGNLQLLREGVQSMPDLAPLADAANNAAARGAALTQRLLAFSRRQTLQPVLTDVNQLATEMMELLRPTLGERIVIETRLAKDLWPTRVDRGQLENAMVNLAVNARDAMPQGGRLVLTTANSMTGPRQRDGTTPAAGGYVQISMSDTGTGMPPEVVHRAFDPFFTTKGPGKGSGLGLSMVYGFVKQSHGHVEIESTVGSGTTIHLFLPRAEGTPAAEGHAWEVPSVTLGQGRCALVVEDDTEVRKLSLQMIERLGFHAIEAADGQAALAMLDTAPAVDLLFTDIVLPGGMSGPDLAELARQRRPGLHVLFTSGYALHSAASGGLPAGAHLLTKPFRYKELASKLEQVLGGLPA